MDDRDYPSNRGRNNRDTYYYNNKQPTRSRGGGGGGGGGGGYRNSVSMSKRIDTYGPPQTKNSYGPSVQSEEKRQKANKETTPVGEHVSTEKKLDSVPSREYCRTYTGCLGIGREYSKFGPGMRNKDGPTNILPISKFKNQQ